MKVFKSLVTLLLVLAMVCDCGVNALASGVASPVTPPTHTHTGGTATCTEPGLTVGIKCSVCDTILQE